MATEYVLAATMLFGSYANPVERPIEGVFADPVQCMSHWQRASRDSGMTFLNIEGTVCVERQRAAKASATASDDQAVRNKRLRAKLTPEQRQRQVAEYAELIKLEQWNVDNGSTEQARRDAAARIRKYEGLIAALQ